ncbi:TIGR04282 family arsenosugar biosynthesis glycosyltransferase [Thiolapillus brandeum]|uniref:Glycosyltransferase n=1 Tax=Thiolapillus brandeum TaxID=1076588 RepID=A0A7U6GJ33_9GAMM|nr:TIGR04282 family arsenosugar biosynthesis glycosyltransferase [Thiolapillus brandeum]BAO44537.1 conserved hypothetical protein [Thiolapillus brandeum]
MKTGRLLVFSRAPVPGKTKTRLISRLGATGAARLHARLIRQTLDTACAPELPPVDLWCAPAPQAAFFRQCARDFPISLHRQEGEDLGQRMQYALHQTLKQADRAILIGTDCPNLTRDDLLQAEELLNEHDAVLGPAHDGGYYLLGLKNAPRDLFTNIPWGSDRVAALTRSRMHALGWSHGELRVQHDLDRPEDQRHFPQLFPDSDSTL